MANKAKSKDRFDPKLPRDIRNIQREGRADLSTEFQAGTLVRRDGERLVLFDVTENAIAKPEIVWTDGKHRVDVERVNLDGTREKEYTTIALDCVAVVDAELFQEGANPAEGMVVLKGEDGQLDAGDLTSVGTDLHLVIGYIEKEEAGTGKFTVKFNL